MQLARALLTVGAVVLLVMAYRHLTAADVSPAQQCDPVRDCSTCAVGCPAPILRVCESCPPVGPTSCTCPGCPSTSPAPSAPAPVAADCSQCASKQCAGKLAEKIKTENKLRVVVSLSTVPCKLWTERLHLVVQGIKEQTFQPDAIYLSFAEKGRRDNLEYIIPPWLKEDKDVTILKTKYDLGPLQKLLPVVAVENNPETRIVTVDDDWQYPKTMIQHMIEWQLEHPDAAMSFTNGFNVTCWLSDLYKCNLTTHGRAGMAVMTQQGHDAACSVFRYKYGWDTCAAVADFVARPVHVIQGVGGCIYARKFFGPGFFLPLANITEWYANPCFYNDDIYIGGVLAERGVNRMVMPQRSLPPDPIYVNGREPRKAKPFINKPYAIKHQKEQEMPLNATLCTKDLHGYGRFGDYSRRCSRIFNKNFEGERKAAEYYQKPEYFLPVEK